MRRAIGGLSPLVAMFVSIGLMTTGARGSAQLTFSVEPTESSLAISGTWNSGSSYGTFPVSSQSGGSDTLATALGGSIVADCDAAQNTFQIAGGTVAAQIGGSYLPPAPPYAAPAPAVASEANFGIQTDAGVFNQSAIRQFAFSLSSPAIASPSSFDAAVISAQIVSGGLDYLTYVGAGSYPGQPVYPYSTTDQITGNLVFASGPASLTAVDGEEILAIPITTQLTVGPIDLGLASLIGSTDSYLDLNVSGNIVATSVVPEPASWAVVITSAAFLFARRRRVAALGCNQPK